MVGILSDKEVKMKQALDLGGDMAIKSFNDEFISEIPEWDECWVHVIIDDLPHNEIAGHFKLRFNTTVLQRINQINLTCRFLW